MGRRQAGILWWRWFSGHPLDGAHRTNATWTRPATRVLHPTGHAVRWHHMPRMHRAGIRSAATIAAAAIMVGLFTERARTLAILAVMAAAGCSYGLWRAQRAVRLWNHDRLYVRPLHHALTGTMGVPPKKLVVARDLARVELHLPHQFTGSDRDKEELTRAVTAKLAIEAPDAAWKLDGARPLVTFTRSQPPPGLVTWDEIAAEVKDAGPAELVVGIGKRGQIVKVSLESDSPHFGISMGTGGGKSNLAAFWLTQELLRGAVALVLDAKLFSHPWIFKDMDAEYGQLPNVGYVRSTPALHDAMVWLGEELGRRNEVAERAINAKGDLLGDVGPRMFIVAEEMNMAMDRLRQYWAEIRDREDPKRSPAFGGLGEVAFAGRAVKMHLIVIGQRLDAAVLGGGAVRENIGVRCLARYTQSAWKMQAGDLPMPPSPTVTGRVQCVVGNAVSETQVPKMDFEQCRDLVLAAPVTPVRADMPGMAAPDRVAVPVPGRVPIDVLSGQRIVLGPPGFLTLAEAIEEGVLGCGLGAARKAAQRPGFPPPAGMRGAANVWRGTDLHVWQAAKEGKVLR